MLSTLRLFNICLFLLVSFGQAALARIETLPVGIASFLETSHLAKSFETQKNQTIPEASQLNFKIDSAVPVNINLPNAKSSNAIHLYYVRGHFKAKWNNDGENLEEESISHIYDAAFLVFESQKKAVLLDEYFSEDSCDGDHLVSYSNRYLFFKASKEQSFFTLDRKMRGDFCTGERLVRSWVDSAIYYLGDSTVRKLHTYVSYDKKETLAFFPDSEEPYVSALTYLRSDLVTERNEKKPALDFYIKSVAQQGIEKPVINKVTEHFTWNAKLKAFDKSD